MTAAHYVVTVARHVSAKKNGEAAVSSVDVHDHMLERAAEHDMRMIILMSPTATRFAIRSKRMIRSCCIELEHNSLSSFTPRPILPNTPALVSLSGCIIHALPMPIKYFTMHFISLRKQEMASSFGLTDSKNGSI